MKWTDINTLILERVCLDFDSDLKSGVIQVCDKFTSREKYFNSLSNLTQTYTRQ